MGLHETLSALRQVLLDLDEIPETEQQRYSLYRQQFPSLSEDEVRDLSAMPADGVGIYRTTIFTGEARVLRNHFPATLALLGRLWPELYPTDFSVFGLARALHKKRPWKSHLTEDLARNFHLFLLEDLLETSRACPALPELATVELAVLEIKRYPDFPLAAGAVTNPAELAPLTVNQLLELQLQVHPCAQFHEFNYTVTPLYTLVRKGHQLPETIETGKSWNIASRNQLKRVRWLSLEPATFLFLQERAARPVALSDFALHLSQAAGPFLSEEQLFQYFMERLAALLKAGACSLVAR